MRRREDAAHQLDRGHREIHARTRAAEGELLLDLRRVAVPDRAERADDADALRVVRVLGRLATAFARADLALDDDGSRAIDDVGGEEREQREDPAVALQPAPVTCRAPLIRSRCSSGIP